MNSDELDELLDQYKVLEVWHKMVKITAVVLLAVMVGFILWGVFVSDFPDLRLLLIIAGVVFGVGGAGLFFVVNRLYNNARTVFGDYFNASGMSEDEVRELLDKHGIKSL